MCPVCTVGVIAGLGLSKWLGISDAVTGIWIGALLVAMSWWTFVWLFKKKSSKPKIFFFLILIGYVLLTFLPIYLGHMLPEACKTIMGIDYLTFGTIWGILIAGLAMLIERILRRKNHGKAYFPYQKVIIPITLLVIASIIINQTCK